MTRAARQIAPVLLLVFLAACASHTQQKLFQAGATSKTLAEASYQAVYVAHKKGEVSEDVMTKARIAYNSWTVAQTEYVEACKENAAGLPAKEVALRRALKTLTKLASQFGYLE